MKSTIASLVLLIIVLFTLTTFSEGTQEKRSLDITSMTMNFEKTDATITVNYEIGGLPKLFILFMGSKSLEPRIKSIFSDFNYDIIRMDEKKAVLHARNVSRLDKGYYLHDSKKFGEYVNTVYIYTTDDPRAREYSHINSTPPIFYRS